MAKQKIIPHLWFDKEAKEAAQFYVSTFGNGSKVKDVTVLHNTPSGDANVVSFQLMGYDFMAISAGPYFTPNPSISFHVKCTTKEEVDRIWKPLSKGGKVLMELGKYPFSEHYGWVQDKYGFSWQVILINGDTKQRIMPALMYVGKVCGKAEEAITLYTSTFNNSKVNFTTRWPKGAKPEKEGTVLYSEFTLEGQEFVAMDSAQDHKFNFNEAISLLVNCETQKEIDYYWKLSADPKAEQCGWLKDKFGVSWQVNPIVLNDMLKDKDQKKVARVTEAFLKMKKFDIEKLRKAFNG